MFHRAMGGQVQFDPVRLLHNAHGNLEQFQDHREGLGLSQFGMDQDVSPQCIG